MVTSCPGKGLRTLLFAVTLQSDEDKEILDLSNVVNQTFQAAMTPGDMLILTKV